MHLPERLENLSAAEREELEELADRFAKACRDAASVDLEQFLPPPGDRLRTAALRDLIQVDLKVRWRRRQPIVLEEYRQRFPELDEQQIFFPQLLLAEYDARHRYGDKPDLEGFQARFPDAFSELEQLVRARWTSLPSENPNLLAVDPEARPQESPPPGPGTQVLAVGGGYRLIKRLGAGAFGEVWRAEAPGGVEVAVKIIHRPLDHQEAQRELQALELIKGLRHNFLLQTQDYWSLEDRLLIVMDLADGSLRDRLEECRRQGHPGIPPDELLTYFREAAEALDFLHSKQVQHRDIKPDNILLLGRHVKVADFGLARLQGTRSLVSATGSGTPAYMAPEVWGNRVHQHSDQYSLAATFVELRLGRRLFASDNLPALMMDALQSTPDLTSLPEAEQQALHKALAKDPNERFPSCRDFVQALKHTLVLGRETVPGAPVTAPMRTSPSPLVGIIKWLWSWLSGNAQAHGGSASVAVRNECINRYTDVSFPSRVPLGKVYPLRVQVVPTEEDLPTGQRQELPKPHAHDVTISLKGPTSTNPEEPPPPIRVHITVAAENFVIDGNAQAEIVVPYLGKSPATQFHLWGQNVGPGRIMLDFAQDGLPVGSVDLSPEVVGEDQAVGCGHAPGTGEIQLCTNAGPAPDVILKVFELRYGNHQGSLHFHLYSTSPNLQDLPVLDGDLGTQDLKGGVVAWVDTQLQLLGSVAQRSNATPSEVAKALTDVGYRLFEQLLPSKLQELCWTFRQRGVRTVLILSDEPHIPWELIKPYRTDPASDQIQQEDSFWGEAYALTHWLRGRPPAHRLSLQRVFALAAGAAKGSGSLEEASRGLALVSAEVVSSSEASTLPRNPAIPSADEEIAILRSLGNTGARVQVLPARCRQLYEALEQGEFDLLHLACHGSFGGSDRADASAVLLEDGAFCAAELSPRMAGALRAAAPLIVFNACHSGRVGFSLTRLGSWGARFVQLGCGGFVGALWPVTDKAALVFAQAFYELLARGQSLGEAVLQARCRVHTRFPNDPSWLAYCCFADPLARIQNPALAQPRT
jgi:serine/threonine protein kinase